MGLTGGATVTMTDWVIMTGGCVMTTGGCVMTMGGCVITTGVQVDVDVGVIEGIAVGVMDGDGVIVAVSDGVGDEVTSPVSSGGTVCAMVVPLGLTQRAIVSSRMPRVAQRVTVLSPFILSP